MSKDLRQNLLTRFPALAVAASLGLAATADARDFVFTDAEGHLVLRFAGADPGGLDAQQMEEVINVVLSTMVHDRLRADATFEAEPVDSQWADSTEPRIEQHMREQGPEFSASGVECRSTSCRLVLEHSSSWSVAEHRSLMDIAQRVIETLIAAEPASFEPVFLIAAHLQEPESPYIKLFLRRAADGPF